MKKAVRNTLKTVTVILLSIVGLVFLSVGLILWITLTPPKITKLVNRVAQTYIPINFNANNIDLTLFKTFPEIGLEINNISLINPIPCAESDTLISIDKAIVAIDIKAFLKKKVNIRKAAIYGANANIFYNEQGESNISIFLSDTPASNQDNDTEVSIDLKELTVKDLNLSYIDHLSEIEVYVTELGLYLDGKIDSDNIYGNADLSIKQIDASINDTTNNNNTNNTNNTNNNNTLTNISLTNISASAGGTFKEHQIKGNITLSSLLTKLTMGDIEAELSEFKIDIDANADTELEYGKGVVTFNSRLIELNIDSLTTILDNLGATFNATADIRNNSIQGTVNAHAANLNANLFNTESNNLSNAATLSLNAISLYANGFINSDVMDGKVQIDINGERFKTAITAQDMNVSADTEKFHLGLSGYKEGDNISITPVLNSPSLRVAMNGDTYINHWPVNISLPIKVDTALSRINLNRGLFSINKQEVSISGNCHLYNSDNMALSANMDINTCHIEQILAMIPDSFKPMTDGIKATGILSLQAAYNGQMVSGKMVVDNTSANILVKEFTLNYKDTITALSSNIEANLSHPSKSKTAQKNHLLDATLVASDLMVNVVDESLMSVKFNNINSFAQISDIPDSTLNIWASTIVKADFIEASIETISANLNNSYIDISMTPPSNSNDKSQFNLEFSCDSIQTAIGKALGANFGKISAQATAALDPIKEDLLLKWNPAVKVDLKNGSLDMLQIPVTLPHLMFDFSLGRFNISESRLLIGNSDISLTGDIYNIDAYLEKTGLLTGEMDFTSNYTDMTELLSIINVFGDTDNDEIDNKPLTEIANDTIDTADPFIVPMGVDFILNTNIAVMEFNNHQFNTIGGEITVKDGVVVLQELGFSSNTAQMQLTAIYKTPSRDNLYTGIDFHLLDIEIDELIDLIPSVDSIVPMLKSFDGKAQFHLAAETYMKANYEPKMPTLIGASAIEAKDLVIMDNKVFNTIKKNLFMSRNAENKIDSLSVELQVLRNKVDLYPFLIHMDKYKAVIGGRHNINKDLDCKYHISLTESPLPIRLGVNIEGSLNDIANNPFKHIKLSRCKYGTMYIPEKTNITDQRTLLMKQSISETLKKNVKQ